MLNIKDQAEIIKKIAIQQLKDLQKKKGLNRVEFVKLINKKGFKISIQAYYKLLGERCSTDTTIENSNTIQRLLK